MIHLRSGDAAHSPRRRKAKAAMGVVAALGLVAGVTGLKAEAAPAPGCPTTGLPFTASLTAGEIRVGGLLTSSGNSVEACGSAVADASGKLQATVPKEKITFGPSVMKMLFFDFPSTFTALTDMKGPVTIDSTGGYHESLTGTIQVSSKIFGSQCIIGPFDITLTTETTGQISGETLKDSGGGDLVGRMASGDFTMPKVAGSTACFSLVAAITNTFVGLPNQPGQATATYAASIKLNP